MSEILPIAAAAGAAAICAMTLRRQAPEIAIALSLCAGALILLYCSGALSSVMGFIDALAGTAGTSAAVLEPVMRVTGIAIVTRLACDLCKDAQEGALASAIELAGSILALAAALPLMTAVLDAMGELL